MADDGDDDQRPRAVPIESDQRGQPYDENLDQLVPLMACCCESPQLTR